MLRKFDFDVAPLLLALVLGDRMETELPPRAHDLGRRLRDLRHRPGRARLLSAVLAHRDRLQLVAMALGYRKRLARDAAA